MSRVLQSGTEFMENHQRLKELSTDLYNIKVFLSDVAKIPLSLLKESYISLLKKEMLICCLNRLNAQALFLRKRDLKKAAVEIAINRITLISLGDSYTRSFVVATPCLAANFASTIMNQQATTDSRILTIPEWDLKQELCQFEGIGGAKVVRFFDDQSIDCNERVEASSGVRPNDWLKLNHGSLWIPEQFSTFKNNLIEKVELRNYPYVARLVNLQKCRFVVDARLAIYRGDLVRIVKVHSCVPIE